MSAAMFADEAAVPLKYGLCARYITHADLSAQRRKPRQPHQPDPDRGSTANSEEGI